jgi:hypothetical protein
MDRVVPMLPRRLCEELCSLQPGGPRLTFSVIWDLSPVCVHCLETKDTQGVCCWGVCCWNINEITSAAPLQDVLHCRTLL